MATTKVYGIYGRTTAVLRVPFNGGKAFMEITFDRGVPNPGPNYRPATFSTSDPVVQKIMEKSTQFNKMYKLYRVYQSEPDVEPTKAEKPAKAPKIDIEPLDGIQTIEEAIAYLKSKGAKATQLKDNESIKKYATKIGVSFPNLNL